MNYQSLLPDNATAEQVVIYIATHVVGQQCLFSFGDIAPLMRTNAGSTSTQERSLDWSALIDEARTADLNVFLGRLTRHTERNEAPGGISVVSAVDLPEWLPKKTQNYSPERDSCLVVCSRIRCSSLSAREYMHIPMMDFRCEPSNQNRQFVVTAMRKIGQKAGVVLESGRSYHYYGFDLLTEDEWRKFMYRSLLLTPFIDSRYIGHRLLSGMARLRITSCRAKSVTPFKVAELID